LTGLREKSIVARLFEKARINYQFANKLVKKQAPSNLTPTVVMALPITTFFVFLAGLVGLVISSYYFVGGSAALARFFGMRPGVIGLTVVAFGTSAPEILVSADAAFEGAPELGIGNALGSNIANIGLVLGATALVAKLPVYRWLFRLEIPLLTFATLLAGYMLFDHHMSRAEGVILLVCAILFPTVFLLDISKQKADPVLDSCPSTLDAHNIAAEIPDISLSKSLFWLIAGLLALLFSARVLVASATGIAEFYEISPLVIGVTIVAIGTSLPELAASVMSALRGQMEMAVGNIVGSNILNIFAVMSMPGLILPHTLEPEVFSRDVMTMGLLTALLIALIYQQTHRSSNRQGNLGRGSGLAFLGIYFTYTAVILV